MARMLTETMKKSLAEKYPLYSQDGKGQNAKCICKFFFGNYTWYITEASFEGDDLMMFGVTVCDGEAEFGYISYNELEQLKWHGWACVERDRYFKKQKLSEIEDEVLQAKLKAMYGKKTA
jgi:hypothetical protein